MSRVGVLGEAGSVPHVAVRMETSQRPALSLLARTMASHRRTGQWKRGAQQRGDPAPQRVSVPHDSPSAPESERPGQWTPAPSAYQVSLPLVRVRGAQAGGGAGGLPRATQRVGDRRASPRHAEGAAEAGRHPAAGVLVRAANGSEGEEAWPLAFCRPRRSGGLRAFPAIVSGAGVQSRPAGFSRARRLTFKFLSPRHSAEVHAGQEGVLFGGWS